MTIHKPHAPIPLDFADVAVTDPPLPPGPRMTRAVLLARRQPRRPPGQPAAGRRRAWRTCSWPRRRVYETKPWGVEDQPDFLNAVVVVRDPAADAWAWLRRARLWSRRRVASATRRWGPRTLDVDVVTVDSADGSVTSDHPDLLLPHPGTPSRATVLIPWLEVEPDATLPGHGPVADLLAALPEESKEDVRLRADLTLTP